MNLEEKLRIARQLDRLRVDVIEAAVPHRFRGRFLMPSAPSRLKYDVPSLRRWRVPRKKTFCVRGAQYGGPNAPAASFPLHIRHPFET